MVHGQHLGDRDLQRDGEHHHSLAEIIGIVQQGFRVLFDEFSFWCVAEISRINSVSGRRYIDLIEFDSKMHVQAKARGIVRDASCISLFLSQTGLQVSQLKGMSILFQGHLQFHQEYGCSISIHQLSATYTLGQLKQQQDDIFAQLQKLGIATQNKQQTLGFPPYRIAVISSESSQGLQDFVATCEQSGYNIDCVYYYGSIHGNQAKQDVYMQLKKIYADIRDGVKISAVAILRGGGGSSGIVRQNDLAIAKGICHMPVPVLLAIGHTTDTSVLDRLVAMSAKTPTDAAHMLIASYEQHRHNLDELYSQIASITQQKIKNISASLDALHTAIYQRSLHRIQMLKAQIESWFVFIMSMGPQKIKHLGYGTFHKLDHTYMSKKDIVGLQSGDTCLIDVYDVSLEVSIQSKNNI